MVLGKVPDDHWVPGDFLVHDDQLIHAEHQGKACSVVSRRVPDNPL